MSECADSRVRMPVRGVPEISGQRVGAEPVRIFTESILCEGTGPSQSDNWASLCRGLSTQPQVEPVEAPAGRACRDPRRSSPSPQPLVEPVETPTERKYTTRFRQAQPAAEPHRGSGHRRLSWSIQPLVEPVETPTERKYATRFRQAQPAAEPNRGCGRPARSRRPKLPLQSSTTRPGRGSRPGSGAGCR